MKRLNRFCLIILLSYVVTQKINCIPVPVIEKHTTWRQVQEQVQDTVVQIFVQGTKLDIIHPYRTPDQICCTGSGFFINGEGDIITNAHVVDQAAGIWVQIPSLGKRPVIAELISICHERDLALLKLSDADREHVRYVLGKIPFLPLGDSDTVRRADEVLVLGYPLSQQSLKSTTGVISGREQTLIQMDATINPGSSGGPMLDMNGEVIGISAEKIVGAGVDNVGYAIPINVFKLIYDDMRKFPLLRKPFLGVVMTNATEELTDYLGNPQPGGCYVVEIIKDSILYKAGLRGGDMIYEIDGNHLDIYGEMTVPGFEDKVSIITYVTHLKIAQKVSFVVYRKSERMEFFATVSQNDLPAIREIYPGYEPMDYEIFAGMVIMPLTVNHVRAFAPQIPGLLRYVEGNRQDESALIVTHVFHNSEMHKSRTIHPGVILNEVNGIRVRTLEELRNALIQSATAKHFTVKSVDLAAYTTENLLVALSMDKVLKETPFLAQAYRFDVPQLVSAMLEKRVEQV